MKNKVTLTIFISLICMFLIVFGVVKIIGSAPEDTSSFVSSEETSSEDVSSEEIVLPDVSLSSNEVFQGDMLTLTATSLVDPVISIDIDFKPKFFEDNGGHTAFLPISYNSKLWIDLAYLAEIVGKDEEMVETILETAVEQGNEYAMLYQHRRYVAKNDEQQA